MVAAARQVSATNLVTSARPAPAPRAPIIEGRNRKRARIALRAWICDDDGSQRGYTLDISPDGARVGGAGTRLKVGQSVLLKIVLDAAEPPAILRAKLVRYHPGVSCPDLCFQFLPTSFVDELFRVARFAETVGA